MAIQWSVAVRNARLAALEATIGTGAHLRFFIGAVPANVTVAFTPNTDLADYTLASDWAGAPANGSVALNNLPLTTTATRAGTIGYYRFYASDNTTCHEQGTVTATGNGGDMTVDNPTVTVGQTINVTAFTKTEPGA